MSSEHADRCMYASVLIKSKCTSVTEPDRHSYQVSSRIPFPVVLQAYQTVLFCACLNPDMILLDLNHSEN